MRTLLLLLQKLATGRGFAILITLYAVVFGAIVYNLSKLTTLTNGYGILDFDRGYSRERVLEVFGSYGNEGMAIYSQIQLLDIVNPAVYSLFFASILYLLWRQKKAVWVVIIPLIAAALDYLENLTLFLLSRSYPDISEPLVLVSSTLSIIKNVALVAAVIALLVGMSLWLLNMLAGKKT